MGRNGLVALRLVLLCMIALLKHGGREALLLAETAIIPTETCLWSLVGHARVSFFTCAYYSRVVETGGRMVEKR